MNNSENDNLFGEEIKKLRNERDLSTRPLAKKIKNMGGKISASYISNIENGNYEPSLKKLRLLAKGLNVPMAYLVEKRDQSKDIEEMQDGAYKEKIYKSIARNDLNNEEYKKINDFIEFLKTQKEE